MELAQSLDLLTHLQRLMDHLNSPGRRQNKLRLNVLWTEDDMKTVAVEQVEDGAKMLEKVPTLSWLEEETLLGM